MQRRNSRKVLWRGISDFAWNSGREERERESRKKNGTHQSTWLVGARTDSLWLCYAKFLAGKRKSGILRNSETDANTMGEHLEK